MKRSWRTCSITVLQFPLPIRCGMLGRFSITLAADDYSPKEFGLTSEAGESLLYKY